MNFFRTTDTTDTTIWKPGSRIKEAGNYEFPEHYYSLRFHGVSISPIQSPGFERGRPENRSMNIAQKEDLFAPGVLSLNAETELEFLTFSSSISLNRNVKKADLQGCTFYQLETLELKLV